MNSIQSPEVLMGRKQAAEYLGRICLTTLDRLNLPRVKVLRRVFYRRSTLDAWLSTQERKKAAVNE
jgi:hypothetical protein